MKRTVMTRAWEIVREAVKNFGGKAKQYISEALKMAWAEIKNVVKFENHMEITVDGYTRELVRWTKGNHDRVYINGGSKKGDGFVDIKNGYANLYNKNSSYGKKMAEMILAMVF